MAYNKTEKIALIDNTSNRMAIATAIVKDIFKTYDLEGNDLLKSWLMDCIMADTLYIYSGASQRGALVYKPEGKGGNAESLKELSKDCIGWITVDEWLGLPSLWLHEYLAIVLGTVVIFLVGFLLGKWRFSRN